jgi:Na+/H+ antiporter NhaD/arsenite permease-like protein
MVSTCVAVSIGLPCRGQSAGSTYLAALTSKWNPHWRPDIISTLAGYQPQLGLVFIVALFAAFASERFPPVTIAVFGAAVMVVLGWVTPDLVTAAFSNPAPIAIAAFFVLSGALVRTGTIEALGSGIVERAMRAPRRTVVGMFAGASAAAAFINNTPVVMVLIPLVRRLARAVGTPATRLLIPLSYISILGEH